MTHSDHDLWLRATAGRGRILGSRVERHACLTQCVRGVTTTEHLETLPRRLTSYQCCFFSWSSFSSLVSDVIVFYQNLEYAKEKKKRAKQFM